MKTRTPEQTRTSWLSTDIVKNIAGAALTGIVTLGTFNHFNSDDHSPVVPTHTETAVPGATKWDMVDSVKNVDDKRDVINWAEDHSPDLEDGSLDVGDEVVLPDDARDIE